MSDQVVNLGSSALASEFDNLRVHQNNLPAANHQRHSSSLTQSGSNNNSTATDAADKSLFSTLKTKQQAKAISLLGNNHQQQLQNNAPPTSPHPSSNSSVSSQALNSEDSDVNNQNNSSSSQPSSYNSSYGSNGGQKLINTSNSSISALVPGGVVTTQNISTVIRPKGNNNSLQFVKIQTPELSKKAVEQIKLSESKEKIKEVEEEWQSNLLNWKSKRRQQLVHTVEYDPRGSFDSLDQNNCQRKTKTFAEILDERAKSGNRLGFNLMRYISTDDGEEDNQEELNLKNDNECSARLQDQNQNELEATNHVDKERKPLDDIDSSTKTNLNIKNRTIDYDIHKIRSNSYNRDTCDRGCDKDINTESGRTVKQNSQIRNSSNHSRNVVMLNSPHSTSRIDRTQQQPFVDNVDVVNNEVSTRGDYFDSGNSGSDEDEEEQEEVEEQRQLQRIAFKAKLKAFESLTKPELKITKPMTRSSIQELPSGRSISTIKLPAANLEVTRRNSSRLELSDLSNYNNNILIDSNDHDLQKTSTPKGISTPEKPLQSPTINNNSWVSNEHLSKPQLKKNISDVCNLPTESSIVTAPQQVSSIKQDFNLSKPEHSDVKSCQPEIQPARQEQPLLNIQQQQGPAYNLELFKQQALTRPPPSSITNKLSNGKNQRSDNNGTVLSVSGRKRCSSCKEELGRGSAAFVVESLSLVYHTNCFRCSVCHVNLSNGFRGVDVRVHAGALHCQNCYSKDGLNYSRV